MRERSPVWGRDLRRILYSYPLRALAAALPPRAFLAVSRLLIPVYVATAFHLESLARPHIARALGLDSAGPEARAITRRFLASNALCRMRDLALNKLEAQGRLTCSALSGVGNLDTALAGGKGALVVSGHFYGNRAAKRYLANIGYPMLSVRDLCPPDPYRGRPMSKILAPKRDGCLHRVIRDEVFLQDSDCALEIFKRLRSGGLVNIHYDVIHPPDGFDCSFLGTRRAFATRFLKIAFHAGCPLVPMLCLSGNGSPSIMFWPALPGGSDRNAGEFVARTLPVLVAMLEAQIVSHPEEWALWTILDQAGGGERNMACNGA